MDPKELSPAYYTSLGAILLGAFLAGLGATALAVLGWVLLIPGITLNVLATHIMIQKYKGNLTSQVHLDTIDVEEPRSVALTEPEPDTETHNIVTPSTADEAAVTDEKIFRPRTPRPRVR